MNESHELRVADTDTHWRSSPTRATTANEKEKNEINSTTEATGISYPCGNVGVQDDFIKLSCCLSLHPMHESKGIFKVL